MSDNELTPYYLSRHPKLSMQQCCCGVQPHGVSCRFFHVTPSRLPKWPFHLMHSSCWLFPEIALGLYGEGTSPHLKVQVRNEDNTD